MEHDSISLKTVGDIEYMIRNTAKPTKVQKLILKNAKQQKSRRKYKGKMLPKATFLKNICIAETEAIIRERHGEIITEPDELQQYLNVMSSCFSDKKSLIGWTRRYAPWALNSNKNDIDTAWSKYGSRSFRLSAQQAGNMLSLTTGEREKLKITSIRPSGMSNQDFKQYRKERDRLRRKEARRLKGSETIEEIKQRSLTNLKPWESMGISRSTWYRKGKPMHSETTASRPVYYHNATDALVSFDEKEKNINQTLPKKFGT